MADEAGGGAVAPPLQTTASTSALSSPAAPAPLARRRAALLGACFLVAFSAFGTAQLFVTKCAACALATEAD